MTLTFLLNFRAIHSYSHAIHPSVLNFYSVMAGKWYTNLFGVTLQGKHIDLWKPLAKLSTTDRQRTSRAIVGGNVSSAFQRGIRPTEINTQSIQLTSF